MNYTFINGGVTAPTGFTANGVCAGVKQATSEAITKAAKANESAVIPNGKRDLALLTCDKVCNSAAIFTKNLVKSDTIYVTQKHLQNGKAQAVIVNSGNANACNPDGYKKAEQMARLAAQALGIGSCYIGDIMENAEQQQALLHLPEYVFPAAMLVFGYPTRQQQERKKPARVAMKHIVHENGYRCMDEEEMQAMWSPQAGEKGYQAWMQAFCSRKYNADFSRERNRSVAAYLAQFEE